MATGDRWRAIPIWESTRDRSNGLSTSVCGKPPTIGKEVFVRVVDEATGGWGHINFGGMYEDPMRLFDD